MSSDNYFLIRRVGDRFLLTNESASLDGEDSVAAMLSHPAPVDAGRGVFYPSPRVAEAAIVGEYAEYGTVLAVDSDHAGDTMAARVAAVVERFGEALEVEAMSSAADGSVVMHTRQFDIAISAKALAPEPAAAVDPWDVVAWFEHTAPRPV